MSPQSPVVWWYPEVLGMFVEAGPSGFSTNNHVFLFSSIPSTCPTHLIHLALTILIILDEECNS
jgi:hypothetical protein